MEKSDPSCQSVLSTSWHKRCRLNMKAKVPFPRQRPLPSPLPPETSHTCYPEASYQCFNSPHPLKYELRCFSFSSSVSQVPKQSAVKSWWMTIWLINNEIWSQWEILPQTEFKGSVHCPELGPPPPPRVMARLTEGMYGILTTPLADRKPSLWRGWLGRWLDRASGLTL